MFQVVFGAARKYDAAKNITTATQHRPHHIRTVEPSNWSMKNNTNTHYTRHTSTQQHHWRKVGRVLSFAKSLKIVQVDVFYEPVRNGTVVSWVAKISYPN